MFKGWSEHGLLLPALCAWSLAGHQARIAAQVEGQLPLSSGTKYWTVFICDLQIQNWYQNMKYILEFRTWIMSFQNLLRNAAKSGCQTNYTYIPDIDMVPTPTMDLQLEQFLATPEVPFCSSPRWSLLTVRHFIIHPTSVLIILTCPKARECGMCAYVVPTYEIKMESPRWNLSNTCPYSHSLLLGCLTTRQNWWQWLGRSKLDNSTRRSTPSTRSQVIWRSGKK